MPPSGLELFIHLLPHGLRTWAKRNAGPPGWSNVAIASSSGRSFKISSDALRALVAPRMLSYPNPEPPAKTGMLISKDIHDSPCFS
jgi:hypothetical protein